jgi:sestrin
VKGEDSWSIGELVHAMIIICTIKSLAGIIFGCGVTPETDFSGFSEEQTLEEEELHKESNSPSKFKDDTNKIMELLKKWEINDAEENQQHFVEAGRSDVSVSQTVEHSSDMSRCIQYTYMYAG